MCDFSLDVRNTRLAEVGDQLFINLFHAGSKGLASRADFLAARPGLLKRITDFFTMTEDNTLKNLPAVCIPPGARLGLSGIPKWMQDKYGVGESEGATFVHLTYESFRYRDAVEFANGARALLQVFPQGVR